MKVDESVVDTDDKIFVQWYCDPDNFDQASKFFFAVSVVLMRAIVRSGDTVHQHVQGRFFQLWRDIFDYWIYQPDKFWFVEPKVFKNICDGFSDDTTLARSLLKVCLLGFNMVERPTDISRSRAFTQYALAVPFEFAGLNLVQLVNAARLEYKPLSHFVDLLRESNDEDVLKEFVNYIDAVKLMDSSRMKEEFKYYRYSMLFEDKCFRNAAVDKNVHIIAYCIGLLPEEYAGATKISGLKNSAADVERLVAIGRKVREAQKKLDNLQRIQFCKKLGATDAQLQFLYSQCDS